MAEPRRKRKERDGSGRGDGHPNRAPAPPLASGWRRGYAKAEVRNQAAREALEPLADGRAAAGGHGRRRPRGADRGLDRHRLSPPGVKVNGATPHLTTVRGPGADHGRHGLGDVAGALLGGARLPG